MWSLAFFGGFINLRTRQGIKKAYPYLLFAMAVLLIIRGSGLNIPYISPQVNNTAIANQRVIDCHD
jgi:hypothetical protein